MKVLLIAMCVAFSVTLFAEGVGETSPRRRPKSIPRVYDQRATIVNMDGVLGVETSVEDSLRPGANQETRTPARFDPRMETFRPLPGAQPIQTEETAPREEERRVQWLRPIDLMGEDELYRPDQLPEREDAGNDLTLTPEDWNFRDLASGEDNPREQESSGAADEETLGQSNEGVSIRERDFRGLAMAPVNMNMVGENTVNMPNAENRAQQSPREERDPSGRPVLTTTLNMGGPRVRERDDFAAPEVDLPGSRSLFNEAYRRVDAPERDASLFNAESTRFRPSAPRAPVARTPSVPEPRPVFSSTVNTPALTTQPMRPAESTAFNPGRPPPRGANANTPDPMDVRRFREDDYRIRPARNGF